MKPLKIAAVDAADRLSLSVWQSRGDNPGLVFDIDPSRGEFICFFLKVSTIGEPPRITFDEGDGFNEMSALSLKSFPLAFYHLPITRVPVQARLRFRPCTRPQIFHLVAFQTSNAILVALLHYLFNLRFQKIGIFGPESGHRNSRWQRAKDTYARITTFFGDVAEGKGLRVQEGSETLAALKLALTLQAADLQARLDHGYAERQLPLISFVAPTYNTPPAYLEDLVGSFTRQRATYAELILSDDASSSSRTRAALERMACRSGIRVIFNETNRGIAATTNAGIDAARGAYVAFIDHDDLFVQGAIAVIADAIGSYPDAIFFYTDELIIDGGLKPIGAFCKPAFDSVLLSGVNYINHFSIYRRDRVEALGGLREDREGSQDYDLLLRYLIDAPVGSIVHIPFLAYMWRREEATYSHVNLASSVASARQALQAAFATRGRHVAVEPARDKSFHRLRFTPATTRHISIVIPNRDSPALIKQIAADLLERTTYDPFDIVIVDNGTRDPETLAFYRSLERRYPNVTIEIVPEPFNFARMCNRGARLAKGDAFLFLNNDIEVKDSSWLAEMVECLSFEATGIVGARLLYPNGRIQHNGIIVGLGGAAGHWYDRDEADDPGPMGRFLVRQTLSAVTAACMLVTRLCFEHIGGFDEENFAIAYNDVDFCLRARQAGFRTIWTPFATLTHHESASRGSDERGEANLRFKQEMARLQARHGTATMIDDAYSPFYDRRESRPYFIVPDALPALRPNVLP